MAERVLRRDRVLDAAVMAFSAHGFAATTLDEVAEAAGVTKRTLYGDVGDKSALFAAAVEREQERIRSVAIGSTTPAQLATEIAFVLLSDSAVALHRAVIAESPRFANLASHFYAAGPQHSIDLLARSLGGDRERAASVYSLLLGEPHRRRLLALDPAPTRKEAAAHAASVLALLAP